MTITCNVPVFVGDKPGLPNMEVGCGEEIRAVSKEVLVCPVCGSEERGKHRFSACTRGGPEEFVPVTRSGMICDRGHPMGG